VRVAGRDRDRYWTRIGTRGERTIARGKETRAEGGRSDDGDEDDDRDVDTRG